MASTWSSAKDLHLDFRIATLRSTVELTTAKKTEESLTTKFSPLNLEGSCLMASAKSFSGFLWWKLIELHNRPLT